MLWQDFLDRMADTHGLSHINKTTFLKSFADKEDFNTTKVSQDLNIGTTTLEKRLKEIYKLFSQSCSGIDSGKKGQFQTLRSWLKQQYAQSQGAAIVNINWREICNKMLEPQRHLSSNSLLHSHEDNKFTREQVYVPLALIERRKPDQREGGINPEAGTKLYEPNYEEKERFEHEAFLERILTAGEGKTKGKQIAIIGEPGAGKTTLLQTIADWVLEKNLGLPIWISLADLRQKEIREYLFSNWLTSACFSVSTTIAEPDLKQQITQGKVWLLLDGVDEFATTGIQALQTIAKQLEGWSSQSRVILTCRLNVWQGDKNALANFETYRLLDFDYPDQVHRFIDNWFSDSNFAPKKERLKIELNNPEKARLRDLIQNPLRLTLLCASLQNNEGKLPETKAGLYAQFVEHLYNWKCESFSAEYQEKRSLNQALGRLALQDIDTGNTRFRLQKNFVREAIKDDSLFKKALQLGWLNNVGIAAESSAQEKVYAFFHASFEEYFAALAVNDWNYFLPRDHVNNPVEGKQYRIFEPKWKEVILLWLGREDVDKEEKETFINALVEFKDDCCAFYRYRAYFLAAAAIAEFKNGSRTDEIVKNIIGWNCGFNPETEKEGLMTSLETLATAANSILPETDRTKAIAALIELIRTTQSDDIRWQAAISLGQIDPGNSEAIAALIELIRTDQSDDIRRRAAFSLGQIGQGNPEAIDVLIELIHTDDYIRELAAESLGTIGQGNRKAIAALIELIRTTQSDYIRRRAAESLGTIDPSNRKAIAALIELIRTSQSDYIRSQAAMSLGQIGQGNPEAIAALIDLIRTSQSDDIRELAAYSLGTIGQGNPEAIDVLIELIRTTQSDYIRRQAAESLGTIHPGNEKASAALVDLIRTTQSDYIRRQAAESLGKIGQGNQKAIDALIELIRTTQSDDIRWRAAESLGKIHPGNEKAIRALVDLIDTTQSDDIRWRAAESLGKIHPGNPEAIAALIQLIITSQDDYTRSQAVYTLEGIVQEPQMAMVVSNLRDYLSDETYQNDFDQFKYYYRIIWKCAQTLSYQEFYQFWHNRQY